MLPPQGLPDKEDSHRTDLSPGTTLCPAGLLPSLKATSAHLAALLLASAPLP